MVAQELYGHAHDADAVSKAYYVMFYAALALLREHDITASKHSAVISVLGRDFAKQGVLDPRFHKMIIKAQQDREAADYDVFKSISHEVANRRVVEAGAFLSEIKRLLYRI